MKIYIIAGEASGDLHGSNLMKEIYRKSPDAEIRFWGGDLMQRVGGTLVKHYRELAFMGFLEVLVNLRTILKNIKYCKADIENFNPDAIVFIDYPGFNMRIAKWAKQRKWRTHYYISPQIWAWKENRISAIKRDVDKMYVILPFEKDFYENKHDFPVEFVGHPLIDAIHGRPKTDVAKFRQDHNLSQLPIVALLPGSRKQEITKMLSTMLEAVADLDKYQFVIAGAPGQDRSFYETFLRSDHVAFVENRTYELLDIADAALVTSGTATLETALYKVPQVVCYKGSWASYQIAKRVVTLKYISLVNLIMDRPIVTELIQQECNPSRIKKELIKLFDVSLRDAMLSDYQQLETKLGGIGASETVATFIISDLISKTA
ncbi:MAG: lipid-A-disaccharide synthase [Flavobacterium sp.]|nr:lipid-A-disaccharide synthase [Flavobacterium sp.]